MRLAERVLVQSALIAVVSVLITAVGITLLSYHLAKEGFETQKQQQLIALREAKTQQITEYFTNVNSQLQILSNSTMVISAMKEFNKAFQLHHRELKEHERYRKDVIKHYINEFEKHYRVESGGERINPAKLFNFLDKSSFSLQYQYVLKNPFGFSEKYKMNYANDDSTYSKVHKLYHPLLTEYAEKLGFHDIMLIDDKTGDVVYSVAKELDFTTSLISGPYADSHLGDVYRSAAASNDKNFVAVSDFAPHVPSYYSQVGFMATPIVEGNQHVGVLVFEMPLTVINKIMTYEGKWQDVGLGQTGETYLVGKDFSMRSQSRFLEQDPETYFKQMENLQVSEKVLNRMKRKKSSVGLQMVRTEATEAALSGETGFAIIKDYRDVWVLSSFAPINPFGLNWAIISEIDKSEAFSSVQLLWHRMVFYSVLIMVGVVILAMLFGSRLSNDIARPFRSFVKILNKLAKNKEFNKRLQVVEQNEMREIADGINALMDAVELQIREALESVPSAQEKSTSKTKTKPKSKSKKESRAVFKNSDDMPSSAITDLSALDQQAMSSMALDDDSDWLDDDSDNDFLSGDDDLDHDLEELSDRLKQLSKQFKQFEDEADRTSGW